MYSTETFKTPSFFCSASLKDIVLRCEIYLACRQSALLALSQRVWGGKSVIAIGNDEAIKRSCNGLWAQWLRIIRTHGRRGIYKNILYQIAAAIVKIYILKLSYWENSSKLMVHVNIHLQKTVGSIPNIFANVVLTAQFVRVVSATVLSGKKIQT